MKRLAQSLDISCSCLIYQAKLPNELGNYITKIPPKAMLILDIITIYVTICCNRRVKLWLELSLFLLAKRDRS
jgi:hypothetical protein